MDAGAATFAAACRMKMNFVFLKRWDTQENLNSHLKSEHFKILRGAMNLLREPYKMKVHTVATVKNGTKTLSYSEVQ
jgi:quinol monooxygenase YgiN